MRNWSLTDKNLHSPWEISILTIGFTTFFMLTIILIMKYHYSQSFSSRLWKDFWWFTLVELLMVIIIVWMLMLALSSHLSSDKQNRSLAEACTNTIYGTINWFIFDAFTSKGVTKAWVTWYPDSYNIVADTATQRIDLWYLSWSTQIPYKTLSLTWATLEANCWDKRYNVTMISDRGHLVIGWDPERQSFFSWSVDVFTGDLIFRLDEWETNRRDLIKMSFDTRVFTFRRARCLGGTSPCPRWLD